MGEMNLPDREDYNQMTLPELHVASSTIIDSVDEVMSGASNSSRLGEVARLLDVCTRLSGWATIDLIGDDIFVNSANEEIAILTRALSTLEKISSTPNLSQDSRIETATNAIRGRLEDMQKYRQKSRALDAPELDFPPDWWEPF